MNKSTKQNRKEFKEALASVVGLLTALMFFNTGVFGGPLYNLYVFLLVTASILNVFNTWLSWEEEKK